MIDKFKADPTAPSLTASKDQSLLPTGSKKLEHLLAGASAKLEPILVPFESIWNIDTAPDELLAALAYAFSVDEYNDLWSGETKREVIRQSLSVHEKKGTLGAVKRALSAMNYDAKIIEWWQKNPQGRPGTFSVAISPKDGMITDSLLQLRAAIDAAKRLSAHYDMYVGYKIRASVGVHLASCIGVEITIRG